MHPKYTSFIYIYLYSLSNRNDSPFLQWFYIRTYITISIESIKLNWTKLNNSFAQKNENKNK